LREVVGRMEDRTGHRSRIAVEKQVHPTRFSDGNLGVSGTVCGLASWCSTMATEVRTSLSFGFHLYYAPGPEGCFHETDAVELYPRDCYAAGLKARDRDPGVSSGKPTFDVVELIIVVEHPRTLGVWAGVGHSAHNHWARQTARIPCRDPHLAVCAPSRPPAMARCSTMRRQRVLPHMPGFISGKACSKALSFFKWPSD
jgi:hypothetical protein